MSADRFSACLKTILKFEGGYVDHPKDPGGATNHGITRKTLASWRGIPLRQLPKSEVRALRQAETAAIYRARYWDVCRCDDLLPGVDLVVFDGAVNSGPSRSVKWLQAGLGVKADAVIGPKTLAALELVQSAHLISAILARREAFLKRLSGWKTFGRGWGSRLTTVKKAAIAASEKASPTRPSAKSRITSSPAAERREPQSNDKGNQEMLPLLLQTAISSVLSKQVHGVTESILSRAISDPKEREKIRGDLSEIVTGSETKAAEEIAKVAASGFADNDVWVKRARPSFLYIIYFMIFGAIPFGVLHAFAPEFSSRFAAGMELFLGAIPELGWYLFGSAYLGYSGLRSWDKKNGANY